MGRTGPTQAPVGARTGRGWLSTDATANTLRVTARTVYGLINRGELIAYRFGRVIRLKADEVDAFIESCRIEPGTLEHLYPDAGAPAGGGDEGDDED